MVRRLLVPLVVLQALALPGCGVIAEAVVDSLLENDHETEPERRVRVDQQRLSRGQRLQYFDSERDLRRRAFELEFYDKFHGGDDD